MFGIGLTEILLILVVALLVVGPKKLPELARTLGKGLAEFRKTADEFKESIYQDDEPAATASAVNPKPIRVEKIQCPEDPPGEEVEFATATATPAEPETESATAADKAPADSGREKV